MKYKASDILKRALSIADMSNTSFLTYREKLDYLNQAWKQASQSAINKGCKYFIESVEVDGNGEWDLPEDFYQIESIRTKDGMIISRHIASTPDSALSYDIIGDKLRIYGNGAHLEVNYWKVPTFLSYPSESKDLDIEIKNIKGGYGNKIVYKENDNLNVWDISEGTSTFLSEIPENTEIEVICGKNYLFAKAIGESETVRMFINYKGETLRVVDTDNVMLDDNGYITEYDIEGLNGPLVKSGSYIYGKVEDGIMEYTSDTLIPFDKEITIFKPISFDSKYGILVNTTMFIEGSVIDTDVKGFSIIDLLKADWETGYGFLTHNGNNLTVESFVPDTLLDFPNTLLFDYLAYILAYMFVLKSGADTTAVSSALNIAEYTFYDSLDNGGAYPRITNVY